MLQPTKYARLLILFFLLVSSAQPSPNFLACTVWRSNAAAPEAPKDLCCADEKSPAPRHEPFVGASMNAHKELPCCGSVIPNTSVSEHHRIVVRDPVQCVTVVPEIRFPFHPSLAATWREVPPPTDVGKEILILNLRI